jgi:hypothetical protein
MNKMTARALSLAIAVAVWTLLSHLAKLPLQVWPVLVGLACFLAAGGGVAALQKSVAATTTGVVWAMLYVTVSSALGRHSVVDALVLGAAAFGMVYQARVPLLGYTAGTVAGAAVSLGAMGTRAVTLPGGIRVVIALAIGAALGYGAEYVAGMLAKRRRA